MKATILKKWTVVGLALFIGTATFAENYKVDASASNVSWLGKKVTGEHSGTISIEKGTLQVEEGVIKGGTVSIDMNSLKCTDLTDAEYNQKLVGHLKSDDFFAVETNPTATLVLKDVKKSGDEYTFSGDLTIKGITKPITFKGTSSAENGAVKVTGDLTIDRSDYDVKYGSSSFFDNLGDKMIYDEFTLKFALIAKK